MDLPAGDVEISGTYVRIGCTVTLPATTVESTPNYPNGPDCGADGTQNRVTIDVDGLT